MSALQLPPGTIVAQKYRVNSAVGFSGAAATYLASTADGREVVLKMFDPGLRQRADIMAAIEQVYAGTNALPPEITVPLLDAGYDGATGAPFSVVERMPIPSLAQIVAQGPLPPDDVARVVAAVATALEQAHRRGLFHHALKPTNVFLSSPQSPLVRLGDFGAGLPRAAVPTQEGYALAVPWLAPEQIQPGAQAGAQADVFALALITFFALTGRSYWLSCQPAHGGPDLASWQQELMGGRVQASARAQQLGAALSGGLDAVLGAALAVDPAQRYRSVSEFAQAFEMAGGQMAEAQATMAFPASGLGGHGDYPPPPPPRGGYQEVPRGGYQEVPRGGYEEVPRAPGQAYPTLQQPFGLPAAGPSIPQSPPIPQAPPGSQAYISMQTPPAPGPPPTSPFEETTVGKPTLAGPVAARPASNRLVPLLVGLVSAGLLIAGVAAWLVMGRKSGEVVVPAASATASAPPADSAVKEPPSPTSTAAASDTALAPTAAPTAAPSSAPSAESSGEPAAAGATGPASLSCDPDCDEIKVDDNAIDLGKPVDLAAGKHVVVASKAGYASAHETIVVKPGEKLEKTFRLKLAAPAAPPPVPAKCGKFLHRGPGCK